jgi:XTP/dITP diphosphohydrolase
MKKIVFATNNQHKLDEIRQITAGKLEILSLSDIHCHDEIAETGATLEENALIKAQYIKDKYGFNCFADDSGLEVEALNGAPGVISAHYAGEPRNAHNNMQKVLHEMREKTNRNARFRTVIALIIDDKKYLFEGEVKGKIIETERGTTGFGYDPIFEPIGYNKTFAELGNDVKNRISHRALATEKFVEWVMG